jgi:hypothetical protein
MTLAQFTEAQIREFFAGTDANNLILQMRTWQQHDVGTTPGFGGSTEKALRLRGRPGAVHALGDRPSTSRWATHGRRAAGSGR